MVESNHIPYIRLSKDELDGCCKVLGKGNALWRKLADTIGMEYKTFRARWFRAKKFNPKDWPELSDEQVGLFLQSAPIIDAVRGIEWKMLCGFVNLANQLAHAWNKRVQYHAHLGATIDLEDYRQEAMFALVDSIYNYAEPASATTKFITFASVSIRNRLYTAANKSNPFSPLTNKALSLLKQFEQTKNTFNRKFTEEEVYEAMNLSETELALLRSARTQMYTATSIKELYKTSPTGETEQRNDYTEVRKGIDHEKDTVPCHFELYDAIDSAELSDLERRVIETSMSPHYGWQSELAKSIINPATGRHYTRMRIGQIYKEALQKVRSAYLRRTKYKVA